MFDILCNFESTSLPQLPTSPSAADYLSFYENAVPTLPSQRGIPKDQQIRSLLATCYTMSQQPGESVSHFAHRFCETQHSLEKLIPGIHKTSTDSKIELIHAFALKLKTIISKDLLAHYFQFASLTELIEAAKRYESKVDESSATASFYSHTDSTHSADVKSKPPNASHSGDNCLQVNKYLRAFCEQSNGRCKKGYIHKCSTGRRFNCKAVQHHNPAPSRPHNNDKKRSHKTFANLSVADVAVDSSETTSLLRSIHGMLLKHETNAPSTSETNPSTGNSQDNLYGMPALSQLPQDVKISNLDLANKNILWCPISSAGVSLPLPLDTCCSVSS